MKRSFVLLMIVAAFGASAFAQTQTSSTRASEGRARFGFTVEPLWLTIGGFGGKIDYFTTDHVSIGFGGLYIPSHRNETSDKDSSSNKDRYNWEHNQIMVGTKVMVTGNLWSNGMYLNPAIGYQTTKISDFSDAKLSGSLSTAFARATAGYQWILGRHLRFAAGAGFMVHDSRPIVIKDAKGEEVLRTNSGTLGGAAIDLELGILL